MLNPDNQGDFEDWTSVATDAAAAIGGSSGWACFLPWSVANAQAIADRDDEFDVTLKGKRWTQKPQKYHARSLAVLRAKYAERDVAADQELDEVLSATGCKEYLAA